MLELSISDKVRHDGIPWEEALRRVEDEYGSLPLFSEVLAAIRAEREERISLTPVSVSQILDHQIKNWYPGPQSDGVWGRLRRRMDQGGLRKAADDIDRHSTEIVERLAEPNQNGERRRGLVVGYVQSGKTASYASVVSKAADAGYRLIIVLAGIHSNLRRQTQLRLDADLGVESGEWFRLTEEHRDFGKHPSTNVLNHVNGGSQLLAVVKKNKNRLKNLETFLRDIPEERRSSYPILIIDDESDQASPDSAVKDEQMSAIHQQLLDIWSLVGNGSYVSYTATPFANLFMEPNSVGSLYPKDFIHVLPEPAGYLGTAQLFGSTLRREAEDGDGAYDVVRSIPNDDREAVVPPPKKVGDPDGFVPEVPPSLEQAITWFVLGVAIRKLRGQGDKHSSMLVHTTHNVQPHFGQRESINAFLETLRTEVSVEEDLTRFKDLFAAEYHRVNELEPEGAAQLTFSQLNGPIREVLAELKVYVDNGAEDADERIIYGDRPQTAIVVGGGTLSRGLTLEGLFVSYFARRSAAYDTLLQMGRWFGFRPNYGDLVRLWLSEGLAGDYQFLADVEAQVRQDIDVMKKNGQTPAQVGIRVLQHPGRLSITGAGKMKSTQNLRLGLEGRRVETNIFDVRAETLRANLSAGERFIEGVLDAGVRRVSGRRLHHHVFDGAPYQHVRKFLESYRPHDSHRLLNTGHALEWLDEWDKKVSRGDVSSTVTDNLWNVVVMNGGRDGVWSAGDVEVSTINRAPLQERLKPSSISNDPEAVGIRALMSSQDHLVDLRVMRDTGVPGYDSLPSKCSETEAAKLRREKASGRGVLVLYVVDSGSQPRNDDDRKTRTTMQTPEHVLGFGMISPSDPHGLARDNEVYVGVVPDWTEQVDDEDVPMVDHIDREGDFNGGDDG
ncbi:Z1 domain-containing protein [Nesterenkonia cremea]|uniref:Endonuclease n=1 Tax=Nesterenkonia cremea TaxID=1882340 RepID=A0A917EQ74_9MICC|nr:Z1 domain-containing protein [Nesterenkonia cremea]GGE65002.1 endonuclease [Nesterenkonia cremea]